MNEVLIFDIQNLQTGSFYRGMGRYSMKLLEEICNIYQNKKNIYFLVNKNLNLDAELASWLNNQLNTNSSNIIKYEYPKYNVSEFRNNLVDYEESLSIFLKKRFKNKKIIFMIMSNFEVFKSYSYFPKDAFIKLLLHYDIIPHLFWKRYFGDKNIISNFEADYYSRYINLFKADKIFTISETSKDDLVRFLFINPDKISTIYGSFFRYTSKAKKDLYFRSKYKNIIPFILFPSGDDLRKNNLNTIKAFAYFSNRNNNKYSLIVTSKFSNEAINKLTDGAYKINRKTKLYFAGYVPEDELDWLYRNSQQVLFTSEYEGLGMPVLEAVNYHKRILVSDISSNREISDTAFNLCDPGNVRNISIGIKRSLSSSVNAVVYDKILKKYTWDNSAKIFLSELDKLLRVNKNNNQVKIIKPHLAVVGPEVTGYSAIVKFNESLIPSLLDYYEITYFFDKGQSIKKFRQSYIQCALDYKPIQLLNKNNYREYNHILYNIGNSEFHIETLKKALAYPGFLIMHESNLSGMINYAKNSNLFPNERILLEEKLEQNFKENTYITSLINSSLGVICHSDFSLNKIKKINFLKKPVKKFNLPIVFENEINVKKINNNKLSVGLIGIQAESKGFNLFLDIIDEFLKKINFYVFGYSINSDLENKFHQVLLDKGVTFNSNLSDYEWYRSSTKLDLIINFRKNYNGEASITTLEGLKNMTPSVIKNTGWFGELPKNTAFFVNNFQDIKKLLNHLVKGSTQLKEVSTLGNSYIKKEFTIENYCTLLLNFFKNNG